MWKVLKKIIQIAAPVLITVINPPALVNTVLGFIAKHFTKIPNNSIPFLNLFLSVGACYFYKGLQTGDWEGSMAPALKEGLSLMGASTAIHQTIKIPNHVRVDGDSF